MKINGLIEGIIDSLSLWHYTFYVVAHEPLVNWRQHNVDILSKLENVNEGIRFDKLELIGVSATELTDANYLQSLVTAEKPLLSLASLMLDEHGDEFHMPMMNLHFDFPVRRNILDKAIGQIVQFDFSLLRTDRYYHLYGYSRLNSEEWRLLNLRFLMIDAIVSPRYIGHSLERGYNLLRLNNSDYTKVQIPHVVQSRNKPFEDVYNYVVAKHGVQRRRSGEPYVMHLKEVFEIVESIMAQMTDGTLDGQQVFDVKCAALLHDTIEDTNADFEDVAQVANHRVAELVKVLSNDKRLRKRQREEEYTKQLSGAPIEAHIIKLADIYSNLKGLSLLENDEEWKEEFRAKVFDKLNVLSGELHFTKEYNMCLELT